MATVKKMTKKDYFNTLRSIPAVQADPALVEFIDHELELLAKKNSAEKKPTAQQTANKALIDAIVNGMKSGRLYTITDLIKEIPECEGLANQKISALVRGVLDTKIERVEDKRKAYFRKIEA